jgi:hypothetical protein
MTQNVKTELINGAIQRTKSRPRKPFPLMSFEETMVLPKGILDYGLDGDINRLTLLDKIGWSPSSSKTRVLISSSYRYGLTTGNYNSQSLHVTDDGSAALDSDFSSREIKEKHFELSIGLIEPFNKLYQKLKDRRLPDDVVLKDEFERLDITESDAKKAAKVFAENLRFLGLVHKVSGKDYIRAVEDLPEEVSGIDERAPDPLSADSPIEAVEPIAKNGKVPAQTKRPALHIDIQVHIDPASSAEQIDQIFASMARHLYGLE